MLSGVVSGDSSVDLSVDDLDSMARYALPRFCREAQSSQQLWFSRPTRSIDLPSVGVRRVLASAYSNLFL